MGADAPAPDTADWGYLKDLDARFALGRTLGRGGSGLVRVVRERASGEEYACKTIRKDLREHNRELVRREVRLRLHVWLRGGSRGKCCDAQKVLLSSNEEHTRCMCMCLTHHVLDCAGSKYGVYQGWHGHTSTTTLWEQPAALPAQQRRSRHDSLNQEWQKLAVALVFVITAAARAPTVVTLRRARWRCCCGCTAR